MGETPETDPLLEGRAVERSTPPKDVSLPSPPERSRLELWLEMAVVLCVVSLPGMYSAVAGLVWPVQRSTRTSTDDSLEAIFYAVAPAVLILYLIHRNGEPKTRFGLGRPRWELDILGGIGLFVVYWAVWRTLREHYWSFFQAADNLIPVAEKGAIVPVPQNALEYTLLGISCCAIGFSEELLARAYFITRFERLLGSAWMAVLASTGIFAIEHIYQGIHGVLNAGSLALFLGIVFCVTRRVWPLAICHAILDWVVTTLKSAA
jgi:membrane protease YdiL (CAAX protease family)